MASILVVDDEVALRLLMRAAFLRAGHQVEMAAGPTEALEACRKQECFDLVVCDIVMPEMDGHHLTRLIAALCPGSRVIHVSGMDPGCNQCPYVQKCPLVYKPFPSSTIVAIANDILSRPPKELR